MQWKELTAGGRQQGECYGAVCCVWMQLKAEEATAKWLLSE